MYRVPIRTKLAAALAVPLAGLCLVTTLEVIETSRDVSRVHDQTRLARASIGPTGVLSRLQDERTWSVVELSGADSLITAPVSDYAQARGQTDDAVAAFRDTLRHEDERVRRAYEPALDDLADLAAIRAAIDGNTAARGMEQIPFANDIYTRYSDLIQPFFEATNRVALAIDDAELRQWTTLVGRAAQQVETLGNLARRVVMDATLGDGINQPGEIAAANQLKTQFDQANQEFTLAEQPFSDIVRPNFPDELVTGFRENVDAALAGRQVDFELMLNSLNVPVEEGFMGLRDDLAAGLNARADELNDMAAGRERVYVGLAVITLGAALVLAWLVSRSITKPLRSLTRQAAEMAERRLPEAVDHILDTPPGEDVAVPHVAPVTVRTRDEVADVAAALNTVQDTALDLAIEQAVLRRNIADSFVNLGRRNQNLLGRQLDFITELESHETDADTLADLFRLDHLATRMRRNAESLLVLAGFDPPRKWAAPVRLSDVIRAALGEVEDYHRVSVRDVEPATILGSAAADLAHLMAELVENALVFSPPDQTVDIRGRHHQNEPMGGGAYTLAVMDAGLGMADDDLRAANRRLAGTESFTIAPSKYLGHYVAGNLAARHRIRVHLGHSPGNGVTATITLPPDMLTTEPVTSDPVTPPHGQRAVRLSPGIQLRGPEARPTRRPVMPAASAAAAAASTQTIWPRTLPPLPPRRDPARTAPTKAPRVAAPNGGNGGADRPEDASTARPPTRRPLTPVEAEANLLASLPRYVPPSRASVVPQPPREPSIASRVASSRQPAAAASTRVAAPRGRVPDQDRPPADAPLTRRVAGAQMPDMTVVPLHEGAAGDASPEVRSAATDMHAMLTSFSEGVQRGLAESRGGAG
jgi:signal transduction histidine kinase